MRKYSQQKKDKAAASAWTWKGWFLFMLGKVEAASRCYDKSVDLDPLNVYGWSGKLWSNFILGKVANLIEATEKVTEIHSENKYAWSIKGWSNFILGKVDQALDCYEKYIEIDKLEGEYYSNVSNTYAYEWIIRAYLLYLLEDYNEAIKYINKALDTNYIDKKYLFALKGEILNSIGKYEEAIKFVDKAIDEKSSR